MAPPRFELLRIGEGDTACEQHRDPLFSAVMRVPDFLSAAECATIVAAADSHLAAMREAQALNPSPRSRLPVANLRCERARTAVERAFDQLLRFLEADAPARGARLLWRIVRPDQPAQALHWPRAGSQRVRRHGRLLPTSGPRADNDAHQLVA